MATVREQVQQYLRQEWFKQREEERRRKATVVSQTVACLAKVRIPCGSRGQVVPYGLICAEWQDTVELAKKLQLPLHSLFPDVLQYRDVKEAHVAELAQRLKDDLQFRWRILNACGRYLPDCERGQAWLSKYLCTTRWLPLHDDVFAKWHQRVMEAALADSTNHGTVEIFFIAFATLLPVDKWPHVYAWCLAFLAHLVDSGTFVCNAPLPTETSETELIDWLLQYYDPDWQCDEAIALKNLSTAWRRHYASREDVLLPLSTCPTYELFESAVSARAPRSAPKKPNLQQLQADSQLIRMSRNSALHLPTFFDPDKLTFI